MTFPHGIPLLGAFVLLLSFFCVSNFERHIERFDKNCFRNQALLFYKSLNIINVPPMFYILRDIKFIESSSSKIETHVFNLRFVYFVCFYWHFVDFIWFTVYLNPLIISFRALFCQNKGGLNNHDYVVVKN
ncbi:unnamed protein product [Protopolystoma xenopodis]|uniref:Uncharacterized protein n=1 Tax=Protopolystoma xenopodis TaxID=117903 RepID=A0A3S5B930_9PLAT|nr:unnamed protein product [Protopolystoma xenopodis]